MTRTPIPELSREHLTDLLRVHDITPTHQRIEIAQVLFSRREHLSAERIMALVNHRHSETSKATVYNTLRLFLEKKLIREVIVDPDKTFFDPNTTPHHHFYDTHSGELIDIPAADLCIHGLPEPPPGMLTESVDIIVRIRPGAAATA